MFIEGRPLLDPGAFAFERRGQARHHHIRQAPFLQEIQEVSVKESAVGPHRAHPHPLRQERQRLLQERHDAARRPRVPTAQPAVQDERRLGQHRQQRVMTVAPLAPGIEPLARAFLLALAAKHRRIQVQREAAGGTLKQPQEPAPERPPEGLNVSLGEAQEEVADRVITGKALQPQQRVQNPIRPQPLAVGEALRPDHDRHQKGRERMRQRNGVVGSRFGKGQMSVAPARRSRSAPERK